MFEPTVLSASGNQFLVGLLALQMDFVSRAALVNGVRAWVKDKRQSLSHVLVDEGSLPGDRVELLEGLAVEHLKAHEDSLYRSLASLPALASVQDDIRALNDADLNSSLAPPAGDDSHWPTQIWGISSEEDTAASGPATASAWRFRILRSHARGGLGEVFVAEDLELHREVALKEMHTLHCDSTEHRSRFLLEAEITGRLEHPGIVPVYGLGRSPEGRPFYAMRLIQGETLEHALQAFHATDARRAAGACRLALRQLLGRFVAVCNIIAFAHDRGIVHRDLKPSNIMLGKFGETLVVDWGLAKALGTVEPAHSETGAVPPPSHTSGSRMGSILGTPAFLSPEQACGRLDQVGPASDVFSLGATLYTVLVSRPPYAGGGVTQMLRRAQRHELTAPRQLKPEVPVALEAICLKALAARPEDRYESALALAADVEHFLAEEPISAWREPWSARCRRWGRQHRTFVAVAIALLVTAVIALTASTILIGWEQAETEAARQDAERHAQSARLLQALAEKGARQARDHAADAESQKRAAEKSAAEAQKQHERAEANFQKAKDAVDQLLTEVGELRDIPHMDLVRRKLLEKALSFYQGFLKERSEDPEVRREAARAYVRIGNIYQTLGQQAAALEAFGAARTQLAALAQEFPSEPLYRRELALAHFNVAGVHRDAGRLEQAIKSHLAARALYQQLADDFPERLDQHRDLAQSANALGTALANHGALADAEAMHRKAIALRQKLVDSSDDPELRRELGLDHNNLGVTLLRLNRLDDARASYRKAYVLQKELAEQFPKKPGYRQDLAVASVNLATILGDAEEARRLFDNAVALHKALSASFPERPRYRHGLAGAYNSFGLHLRQTSRHDDAHDVYGKALAIQQKLIEECPDRPDYQSDLGGMLHNHALVFHEQRDFAGARKRFDQAVTHQLTALKSNPNHPVYRSFLRNHHASLANTLLQLGDHKGAVQHAEQLPQVFPAGWQEYHRAACFIARAVTLAAQDETLGADKGREAGDAYAVRAVALIDQSIQQGFANEPRLADNENFAGLRARADFQRLVKTAEKRAP